METILSRLAVAETSQGDSESDTVCDAKISASRSTSGSISPMTRPSKPYQATVEDDDTEVVGNISSDGGDVTPDSPFAASPISPLISSPLQTADSSVRSESVSSATSISSTCQQDVAPFGAARPSSLRSFSMNDQKVKPNVRWSNRRPTMPPNRYAEGVSVPPTTRIYFPPRPEPASSLSAIDQKWGQLFDDNQEPTGRLKQVLRGIANYLVCTSSEYHWRKHS
jgi:hypothetical protein